MRKVMKLSKIFGRRCKEISGKRGKSEGEDDRGKVD